MIEAIAAITEIPECQGNDLGKVRHSGSDVPPQFRSYAQRIDLLRQVKLAQTREKQQVMGTMDYDDHALILPSPERRDVVKTMSASGMPITDCRLNGIQIQSNHPSGGFFGPKAVAENFRILLENHPVYIDPVSSLAGGYMTNFNSYRTMGWNPDFDYSPLKPEIERYKLATGIGGSQHFCQDLQIGLDLGWGGILNKIRHYHRVNALRSTDFYNGLEDIVLGMQNWIGRTAQAALQMAQTETDAQVKVNLLEMAVINDRLVKAPPTTFRAACQWILWYQSAARMYNGSGSLGRLDVLLEPYYRRDLAAGCLTDEEALFDLACLLVRDTAYSQLGGPDATGRDQTSPVSYLALEAAHRLKIPVNLGVCVGEGVDPNLLKRGIENMFEDKTGVPKFLGINQTTTGFMKNGYPAEIARLRAYSGCHWSALPGREYTLNDMVKINFAVVFDIALREMLSDVNNPSSVDELVERYSTHMQIAVDTIAQCMDFQVEHMHQVFPELFLDLLCYGPIEKGEDASHGGVEFYNLCIDGAGLAVVADSFAALEQRIEREQRLTWSQLLTYLDSNWAGPDGEKARLMMRNVPRYGHGGTHADAYAIRVADLFTEAVKRKPTPAGYNMIPGLFSWANAISMGKDVGATPDGRRAYAPISHGANPTPGFRRDSAATAMAVAIASVQPGYGNAAPMQIELDPMVTKDEEAVDNICSLIRSHFDLGGTQINLNIMDAQKVLEAHKNPTKYPDLIVRVTGFSAYFASLSTEMRQLVVDRIIAESL
jgi:pyruvate-formate lyase